MLTAMMAVVEHAAAPSHDIWEVNTDFEYHEEQRLEPAAVRTAAAAAAGES